MLRYFFLAVLSFYFLPVFADPTPTPPKKTPSNLVPVDELRLEVAEAQYSLKKTGSTISELIAALETDVIKKCFQGIHKTLSYLGNPTDPQCSSRIDRLLTLETDNPLATCAKEGIDSANCRTLYSNQEVLVYDSSQDGSKSLLDPTMRIGYTSKELTLLETSRSKSYSLQDELRDGMNPALMIELQKNFDSMLKISCRPTSERLIEKEVTFSADTDLEIKQVKDKLLAIPVTLRRDYQQEMLREYEKKSKLAEGQVETLKKIVQIMKVIQDPERPLEKSLGELKRTRFIMPDCYKTMQTVAQFDSRLPWPICYYSGWYTPQCIDALRNWKKIQLREKNPVKPKNEQVIGTF